MTGTRVETAQDRAAAVERVAQITQNEDPSVKVAALEAISPATQPATDDLWRWLVLGLLVLTGISLIGLVFMVGDGNDATPPDLVLTAFTALLSGLLGLFIRSPAERAQTNTTGR